MEKSSKERNGETESQRNGDKTGKAMPKARGSRQEKRRERVKRGSGEMAERGLILIIRINESTHQLIYEELECEHSKA